MRLLMRFMKPYRGLIAVTLFVLLIDNVGTLLVPTMLANMVNTGITTGDVDYILRNGLYMLIATGMASGGAVLGCYLSARLAATWPVTSATPSTTSHSSCLPATLSALAPAR